ncbi:DUF3040 domain-containing protein [Streptomyces sp. HUAS MG47]|uniref:DUF3040 domain-containing protein n=1 Tax=Streptomyces solicamelliae TaxID=3231716 RepID=UPI003877B602
MDPGRDDARLSERERRILDEIEGALRADEPLERSLSTMRRHQRAPGVTGLGVSTAGVAFLGALTAALLVVAVATEAPALIWAFAAAWVLTLVCLLRLLIRWAGRFSRRGAGADDRGDGDRDRPDAD